MPSFRGRKWALALLAPALIAAAAEGPGGRERIVREVQLQFPENAWIVGYGEADTGAADAEVRAMTDAAAAIRSEIRSNFKVVEVGTAASGGSSWQRTASDDLERRVTSEVGAFIRARPELTTASGGTWYAVAVASRVDLDRYYVEQGRPITARLEALYRAIGEAPGWISAATPACQAAHLEATLDRKSEERQAISRRGLWTPELTAGRERAVARRQRARAETAVLVGTVPALASDPADSIARGTRDAGWRVEIVDDPRCRGPEDVLVRGFVTSSCEVNEMIAMTMCRASLRYEGVVCRDRSVAFSVTSQDAAWSDSRPPEQAKTAGGSRVNASRAASSAVSRLQQLLGESCAGP